MKKKKADLDRPCGRMSGNTDGSSRGGVDGEMNENTGSVSLPGKNKYKSSKLLEVQM